MKSEKTEKELTAFLGRPYMGPSAKMVAAFLGVELAPRAKLPGWVEGGVYAKHGVALSYIQADSGTIVLEVHRSETEALDAFVEVHRRWLAAKRELERLDDQNGGFVGGDARSALRILRGED